MKAEEFYKLTKEEQQLELEKCSSFGYFYNNYCRRDGMPEYSEKAWQEYIENNKRERFSRRRVEGSYFYPLTPEDAFKTL